MNQEGINIAPTATVHPTVILEGNITIGAYTYVGPGTVLKGGTIVIGHHTNIQCNVAIRGSVTIGDYTHVYDLVNIEGGRPKAPYGSSTAKVSEKTNIGNYCWVNHGATMHGTYIGEEGAVGGNTFCDYGTRIEKGAILGNGSATNVDQVVPENTLAQGVPATVVRENLTDEDRTAYFGLHPKSWTIDSARRQEENGKGF
jgi:carbonic anhydrase/acetyltransferase-like protein (isoleucine patch superfamily)